MGLLRTSDTLLFFEDFDTIENYASVHKTKVVDVSMFRFDRLSIGKVFVTWADKAVSSFVGSDYTILLEYMRSLKGWPTPREFGGAMPRNLGEMYLPPEGVEPNNQEEGAEHADRRVVRRRTESNRQRRCRKEMQV